MRPFLFLLIILPTTLACFGSAEADRAAADAARAEASFRAEAAEAAEAAANDAAIDAAKREVAGTGNKDAGSSPSDPHGNFSIPDETELRARATQLIDLGLERRGAWEMLEQLCTTAPKRLAGSPGFEKAVDWGFTAMNRIGLQNVRLEAVMVPRWVRGRTEELGFQLSDGSEIEVPVTALGGSIATGPGGVRAEVFECDGLEGVAAAGEKLRGKIAFLSRPMRSTARSTGQAYGEAVPQRTRGAIEAAKFGAVGVIVRSMSTAEDDFPHTGAMRYEDGVMKIPSAAIGVISSKRLSAELKKGIVEATLTLQCETLPDVEQWNVVGEIPGTDLADEIVVVGGHLDAWGTGVGAHDDGAGCAQSLECARLIMEAGIRPRRTVRVVLFANEENGLAGGNGYAAKHSQAEKHFLAMETDSGAFGPRGIGLSRPADVIDRLKVLGAPLGQVGAERLFRGGGGADIGPLSKDGCIMSSLKVNDERYFDVHHSANDTLESVNPREIELGAVVMAYWVSIFASMDEAGMATAQAAAK
ncbi:MAG: M20/M25/M40 family metallo-hydrolase [Planctomycetes bacterium]|nr:M20/M25/M40 family metallo-hydrolase [Planctomycetota bacterium]